MLKIIMSITLFILNVSKRNAQTPYICTYETMINSKCCNGNSYVQLSNDITTIPNDQFYGCDSLQVVTIPSSVTSIGLYIHTYYTILQYL